MDKLLNEFLREYIETHAQTLLTMENSGLIQMIKQEKYDEIKLMFSLFKRCPNALEMFKKHLKTYIVEEGLKLVKNESIENDELVRKIIEFRTSIMDLLQKSLEKDMTIDVTIKNSFEMFINENDKTARSLVMHLDDNFKKDFKNNTETEISEKIDKIIQIFRYLQDKDVFENFYKNTFAKRLLDSRRVLEDAEKEVIKKLKEECGFLFTQRLEVMFKDIKMSEQRMQEFKQTASAKQMAIELNVKVLTTGHWPNESRDPSAQNQSLQKIEVVQIPQEIKQCMSVFKQYYMSKFSGRQLHWKLN
jgi:cullin 3